jgi:cellulose biosynthesis protein BcsQ
MSARASIKVAVLNYSGNVGKTTLARHLLQPRMGNCPILFIESINEGGDETNVKGKDFASVMVEVLASDSAIVDIGSSNIEQVFAKVGQMGDVLDGFDFILIPTVAKAKQQADTVKVLRDLIDLSVPTERLKLVLNHVDHDDDIDKVFANVLKTAHTLGIAYAVVHESEGFAHLAHRTVSEVAASDRDFRKEIAAAESKETKRELATAQVFSRIAQGIERELDTAFVKLFETA